MDQKSKHKSWNIKLLEENTSVNLHDIVRQWFLRYDTKSTSEQKMKKDKLSFINSLDFCPPKLYKEHEEITHKAGENICNSYIR